MVAGLAVLVPLTCLASVNPEEEDGLNYDAIVQRLSDNEPERPLTGDPFENVKIHIGVGLANSVETLRYGNGDKTNVAQRGVQIAMGIDLFSKTWLAEGTFRNFGETEFENANVGMKEFDLKVVYQSRLAPSWYTRLAGGLSARYLKVFYHGDQKPLDRNEYDTPASVLQAGLTTVLTPGLSFGTDLAYRNSLIDETPDKSSFDLTLRLDGHF